MKCLDCLCLYNRKDKCTLKKLYINQYGSCDFYKENEEMLGKWCRRYVSVYLNDDCKLVKKENFRIYK